MVQLFSKDRIKTAFYITNPMKRHQGRSFGHILQIQLPSTTPVTKATELVVDILKKFPVSLIYD